MGKARNILAYPSVHGIPFPKLLTTLPLHSSFSFLPPIPRQILQTLQEIRRRIIRHLQIVPTQLRLLRPRQGVSRRDDIPNLPPIYRPLLTLLAEVLLNVVPIVDALLIKAVEEGAEDFVFLVLVEVSVLDSEVDAGLDCGVEGFDTIGG